MREERGSVRFEILRVVGGVILVPFSQPMTWSYHPQLHQKHPGVQAEIDALADDATAVARLKENYGFKTTKVAIKKVKGAFDDMIDAKRILREVRLMRQFSHPNVIALHDMITPSSVEGFNDVYIITELMSRDLQEIIFSRTSRWAPHTTTSMHHRHHHHHHHHHSDHYHPLTAPSCRPIASPSRRHLSKHSNTQPPAITRHSVERGPAAVDHVSVPGGPQLHAHGWRGAP